MLNHNPIDGYCYQYITHSLAFPLPQLVQLCLKWPMPVYPSVQLHRPTLLIFDPRDEIIHFPASLISGLTHHLMNEYKQSDLYFTMQSSITRLRTTYRSFIELVVILMNEEIDRIYHTHSSSSSSSSSSHRIHHENKNQPPSNHNLLFHQLMTTLVQRCMHTSPDEIISSSSLSNTMKVLLLVLQAEVLGIPLIEILWREFQGNSQEEFFVSFMTVWDDIQ